jgi:hypothetical protein
LKESGKWAKVRRKVRRVRRGAEGEETERKEGMSDEKMKIKSE